MRKLRLCMPGRTGLDAEVPAVTSEYFGRETKEIGGPEWKRTR